MKNKDVAGIAKLYTDVFMDKMGGSTHKNVLAKAAKTWIFATGRPVTHCYENHCNSDIDQFKVKHNKLSLSQFSKNHCSGGSQCGVNME